MSELNQSKISSTLINQKIAWKFKPPSSPWVGGSWESILKITKRCLTNITKDKAMTYETLVTFLTETEATLNSRPLTQISNDINDFNKLTPKHFILGKQPLYFSPNTIKDDHVTRRTCWKAEQALRKMFCRRFMREYLRLLQIRIKWNKYQSNLKQKDLVLVREHNIPQTHRPIATVIETYPGKHGIVRSAKIKLPNPVLTRPCNKLCMLEECN